MTFTYTSLCACLGFIFSYSMMVECDVTEYFPNEKEKQILTICAARITGFSKFQEALLNTHARKRCWYNYILSRNAYIGKAKMAYLDLRRVISYLTYGDVKHIFLFNLIFLFLWEHHTFILRSHLYINTRHTHAIALAWHS